MEDKTPRPNWKSKVEGCLCCLVTAIVGILLLIGIIITLGIVSGDVDPKYGFFLIPFAIVAGIIFLPIIFYAKKD